MGLALLLLSGCDAAQEDRAAETAAEAVREANEALNEAGKVARQAGDVAREGAEEAGRMLSDGGLTARVKTALLADESVPGSQIDVDSNGGVVILSGRLSSQTQVDRALSIARGIDGVERVDNRMTVEAAPG